MSLSVHVLFISYFCSLQSGSQNDLVDSWRSEDEDCSAATNTTTSDAVSAANARWNIPSQRNLSAEYPFHKNLCMPPQGINFDLTHKRGKKIRNLKMTKFYKYFIFQGFLLTCTRL